MTIGIIGAMDEEIALIKQEMTQLKETVVANTLFVEGMLKGKRVVLLKSGIGKVNAAMATTIMHEQYRPACVINTGSAGGVASNLEVGDIVISTSVIHHDVDATAFNYVYGQVPQMPFKFHTDNELAALTRAAANSFNIRTGEGVIATGDSFISDPVRVREIQNRHSDVLAVEMEAAAIAQVCYQYDVPFIVIRALSDIAGKESPVSFDTFLETAAQNASALIFETVPHIE
ncbi:Adenosylhomocysteine nucleosidase [Lentibacillus sp. JNUCC-1]|uniref:5'-methylthioadenosine/adenosylhomocysteine nucleosidase n=1 Tax=Lentibacillus sp. JNUCC-1 TaxID=2654513 RepID=UPI0012E7A938|nr:5'-methylthioadenosine/adenosylhomocysteine nucleosidase [Lentibacillus sp. JNUCC-1]MUV39553.1 Adenosylhomocysteine nucleosidase [Lentibacillus sp. JNUCC-1]